MDDAYFKSIEKNSNVPKQRHAVLKQAVIEHLERFNHKQPLLVFKDMPRQTVLNESLDNKILALYAIGMSYEAISEHLAEMYGMDVSSAKISLVTDKLLPLITEWRNRTRETVYPIVFLDAMHFKVRVDGKVTSKAFYSVLAFTSEGKKDILGLYLSENEGARFLARGSQ